MFAELLILATAAAAQPSPLPRVENGSAVITGNAKAMRLTTPCHRNTGYIGQVNNRFALQMLTLRGGELVHISGKGFHARRPRSGVYLFPNPTGTGFRLSVLRWNDGYILARVPERQTVITAPLNDAYLFVEPITPEGYQLSCRRQRVQFIPNA